MSKQAIKSSYKYFLTLCIAIFFISITPHILKAEDLCFIQIDAPSDIKIFVDDIFIGITGSNPNIYGLYIENIKPGIHKILAKKDGYFSHEGEILVTPKEVHRYTITHLIPKIEIKQEGAVTEELITKKVGDLLVRTLPIDCKISIPSLRIIENNKKKDRWIASSIPIGKYQVKAQRENLVLDTIIEIKINYEVQLMFNFVDKSIKVFYEFKKGTNTPGTISQPFDSSLIVNVEISKTDLTVSSLCYKLGIIPDSTVENNIFRIANVRYYSPAYQSKIFKGNIVKSFNGAKIQSDADLFRKIQKLPTDSTYNLEIEQRTISSDLTTKVIKLTLVK